MKRPGARAKAPKKKGSKGSRNPPRPAGDLFNIRDFPPGLIGIPSGDWLWADCIVAAFDLYGNASPPGSVMSILRHGTTIAQKRNYFIENFLINEKLQWLLFLDSDMQPERNTLGRLLSKNKPIVSALYFTRRPPYYREFGGVDDHGVIWSGEIDEPRGLQEVEWAGGGCLLVQRHVFTTLQSPWFHTGTESNINEDLNFCEKARQKGFSIYVDTTTGVSHMGAQSVDQRFAETWRKDNWKG